MAKRRKKKKKKGKKFTSNFGSSVAKNAQQQRQSKNSYGYLNLPSGLPIFSPEPKTKVMLDIMPYVVTDENHPDRYDDEGIAMPGTLWYRRPFSIHRQIGVDNNTVVCPRSIGRSRCPICEYRERKLKEGANWDDDDIQQIKPSDRNLYVVIPINSGEYDEVPHVWDMSQYLFQELLNEELEEKPEMGVFPDLEEGKTLKIRFAEGTAFNTSFAEASRIDFHDRDAVYDETIMEDIPNLDEVLKVLSPEQLETKFFEISEDDYASADVEEETTDRRSKTETRSAAEEDWEEEDEFVEDEDWEEDEEFEEEFEDEFEDEEEWFDEEDEFEEEPEPEPEPKRTKKPKKKKKPKRKKKRKRKKK